MTEMRKLIVNARKRCVPGTYKSIMSGNALVMSKFLSENRVCEKGLTPAINYPKLLGSAGTRILQQKRQPDNGILSRDNRNNS